MVPHLVFKFRYNLVWRLSFLYAIIYCKLYGIKYYSNTFKSNDLTLFKTASAGWHEMIEHLTFLFLNLVVFEISKLLLYVLKHIQLCCYDSNWPPKILEQMPLPREYLLFIPEFCNSCFISKSWLYLKLALNRLFCSFRPVGSPN